MVPSCFVWQFISHVNFRATMLVVGGFSWFHTLIYLWICPDKRNIHNSKLKSCKNCSSLSNLITSWHLEQNHISYDTNPASVLAKTVTCSLKNYEFLLLLLFHSCFWHVHLWNGNTSKLNDFMETMHTDFQLGH
jgi:hypothetical protein